MGWATGSNIAEEIWSYMKDRLDIEGQKELSKKLYNTFCKYDADDWTWEEGSLMYDAYKLNNPEEWKRLEEEC